MNLQDEVIRRVERGQPFRMAVPLEHLSAFLADLVDLGPTLPAIVVRRAQAGVGDALLDFAGKDDNWMLAGSAAPES